MIHYLFGDSIGQGVVLDPSVNRYRLEKQSAVRLLQAEGVEIDSYAIMGCTVEKGLNLFERAETLPGNRCVIEFGGNDCDLDWKAVAEEPEVFHDGKVPLERFKTLLREFVEKARARDLIPELVTPPPIVSESFFRAVTRGKSEKNILRYLGDIDHIYRWQRDYAEAVKQVAEEEGVRLLDVRRAFEDRADLESLYCGDGMHPNAAGHRVIADYLRAM